MGSNYDNFFREKLADQQSKAQSSSDAYNARQEMMRQKRQNQANDFANTTNENIFQARMNEQEKMRTESHIKKLEEEEMRMLSTMQATMSKKQEALKKLASK